MASKRIKGITIELNGDATGLNKALADVDRNLGAAQRSLNDVNRLLKLDPSNVTLIAQKQKLLQSEIEDTQKRLVTLREADKQAKKQLESGKLGQEKYDALQREIIETETKLTKLNDTSEEFNSTLKETASEVSKTSKEIGNIDDSAGEAKKGLGSVADAAKGGAMMQVSDKLQAVSGKLIDVGKNSIDTAMSFETAMSQAAGALNKPMDQMGELKKLATEMGTETVFSSQEAMQAITELAKGGLSEAEISAGALKTTMDMAASSGMSLGDSANVVVQVMGAFELSANESAEAANALAGAAAASSTDVAPLTEALSQCSAVAHNAGWDIQETSAVLAKFADAGIRGSDAGTSLKTMLMRLSAPTDKAAGLMKKYGINVRDSQGNMLGASEIAELLQNKLGGLSSAERDAALSQIFGSDATRVATVMMNSGAEGLEKYKTATENQSAAQELANSQMGASERAMETMRGAMDSVNRTIGEKFLPVVESVAEFVQKMCEKFEALPEPVQDIIVAVGAIIAILGALLPVILAVGGAITAGIVTPMLPVIGIIAGVIAAITAIILVIKNWGAINEWFGEVFKKVGDWIKETWEKVKKWFSDGATAASNKVKEMKEKVVNFFKNIIDGAKEKLGRIKDTVANGFEAAINWLKDLPKKAIVWGKDFIQGLVDGIKSMIGKVTGAVKDVASKITSFLHFSVPDEGPLTSAPEWMPDMIDLMVKGLKNNEGKLKKAAISVANKLSDGMSINASMNGINSSSLEETINIPVNLDGKNITQIVTKRISKIQNGKMRSRGKAYV